MDTYIPIGKMAEINHTTVATLRLYDQKGLLCPRYTDPKTGYRYYSMDQSYRFDMICYMKDLGMSLGEIEYIFRKEDIMVIEDILSRKHEQLHSQLRTIKARHNAVERAISSIERCRKSPARGTITLEYIDRRTIWSIPAASNFYELGIDDFRRQAADLREKLIRKGGVQVHSYNLCTSIAGKDYREGRFVPDRIFVVVDPQFEFIQETSELDSGMYACIYLDNFDDEIPCARQLLDYCRAHNYRICGDYICEIMTVFRVFESEKNSMFLRLQVPVNF